MAAKIICPICDEELGNCVDDVPEKCPICDTRKHEILQEMRDKQEEEKGQKVTTFMVEDSPSEVLSASHEKEVKQEKTTSFPKGIVEEVSIFPQANTKKTSSHTIEKQLTLNKASEINDVTFSEAQEVQEDVVFSEKQEVQEDVVFSEKQEVQENIFSEPKKQSHQEESISEAKVIQENFDSQETEDREEDEGLPVVIQAQASVENKKEDSKKPKESKPYRSGASSLEKLPVGFQYCSSCNSVYEKNDAQKSCSFCSHSPLTKVEKGFPPGHYIILYNHEKKAISYFCLEPEGSIFIGRSSERGSQKDIDLSIAWKNYYYKQQASSEEFKEQMTLLKGISRKHALIRYSKEDQKYILFHLSDKNYTLIQTPNGEKRVRAPKNRNKIELQPGTWISLGNQKEFIILRYKIITIN